MAEKLLPKISNFQNFEKLSFGDFMSKCTSEVDVQINTQMIDIFSSQRGLGKFQPNWPHPHLICWAQGSEGRPFFSQKCQWPTILKLTVTVLALVSTRADLKNFALILRRSRYKLGPSWTIRPWTIFLKRVLKFQVHLHGTILQSFNLEFSDQERAPMLWPISKSKTLYTYRFNRTRLLQWKHSFQSTNRSLLPK